MARVKQYSHAQRYAYVTMGIPLKIIPTFGMNTVANLMEMRGFTKPARDRIRPSRYMPHQGEQEKARRRRQMAAQTKKVG